MMDRISKFYFESKGLLKFKYRDENDTSDIFIDENVLIYGYQVDVNQIIHLVYLLLSGELIYCIYNGSDLSKSTIAQFDTKSNYYGQIEILLIEDKLNILYSYSNYINSNIFTIHHVVYNNKIENKYSVVRYISKISTNSFSVGCDTLGNIHLLYNTFTNDNSFVYYIYYNVYSDRWINTPLRLSKDDKQNENPIIYVDSKNNLHSIWWEKDKQGLLLKYSRMSSSGKDKFKWNEIKIPYINTKNSVGYIFEEDNVIKVSYDNTNSNLFIVSYDFGLSWKEHSSSTHSPIHNPKKTFISDKKVEIVTKEIYNYEQALDQILFNQKELKLLLNNVLEEQLFIKSKLISLEENGHKQSFLSKIFNSD